MRNISPAGLAQLATQYGGEPITIVEVDWAVGRAHSYADRDVSFIPGRIIEVGDLDNVVGVSNNSSSQSLNVTLDDTDGTIKAIFDGYDIHKRDARVYQWFEGLALTDKFLLFSGKISSPITWNERDRTVKFTIISQLEDKEVGFSAEEGQFPYLPADLVGKAWPLIFGTVQDSPVLQINHAVTGTTLTPVGIISGIELHLGQPLYGTGANVDGGAAAQSASQAAQLGVLWCALDCWEHARPQVHYEPVDHSGDQQIFNTREEATAQDMRDAEEDAHAMASATNEYNAAVAAWQNKIQGLRDQIEGIYESRRNQGGGGSNQACAMWSRAKQLREANEKGLGANPINILGGEDFPQNQTLCLDINGGLFYGYFIGNYFYIETRYNPAGEQTAQETAADRDDECPYSTGDGGGGESFDFKMAVPCSCLGVQNCMCSRSGTIVATGGGKRNVQTTEPILQQFWAEAGASVKMSSDEQIVYIASIIPGTVLAVKAFKQFVGERRLINVPSDLYRVESVNYGAVTAVLIIFTYALSTITDQGWSDDIYVTFQSTIGPNVVDILKHLIDTYTDLDWDDRLIGNGGTFAYVRTKLVQFPANFPLLERKNTLTVLQEIAFQARCALWISNGVFYIKYLPEVPSVDDTINVSDVDAERGVEVDLTPTENLVTKMTVKWRVSWAPGQTDREKDKSEKHIILRHNIERYGTQEQEYDFYIYNQPDTVLKCATFWLIRKSITWKTLKFKTFLNKLTLETFDCAYLDFAGGYVADGAVKAVVNKASYNSADNTVDFECIVPVRSGTMKVFDFYWPAALPLSRTWPPPEDIASGDAGGGGIGVGATGNLPIGDVSSIEDRTIFVGGPNVVFGAQSDRGDRTPTDIGFSPQTIINPNVYGELDTTARPHLNLRVYMARPLERQPLGDLLGGVSIDLHKTIVTDSLNPDDPRQTTYLSTFFDGINENGRLIMKETAKIGNTDLPLGRPLTDIWKLSTDSERVCLRTDLKFVDVEEQEARFDFKYDEEGEIFGAGTAFLHDDDGGGGGGGGGPEPPSSDTGDAPLDNDGNPLPG